MRKLFRVDFKNYLTPAVAYIAIVTFFYVDFDDAISNVSNPNYYLPSLIAFITIGMLWITFYILKKRLGKVHIYTSEKGNLLKSDKDQRFKVLDSDQKNEDDEIFVTKYTSQSKSKRYLAKSWLGSGELGTGEGVVQNDALFDLLGIDRSHFELIKRIEDIEEYKRKFYSKTIGEYQESVKNDGFYNDILHLENIVVDDEDNGHLRGKIPITEFKEDEYCLEIAFKHYYGCWWTGIVQGFTVDLRSFVNLNLKVALKEKQPREVLFYVRFRDSDGNTSNGIIVKVSKTKFTPLQLPIKEILRGKETFEDVNYYLDYNHKGEFQEREVNQIEIGCTERMPSTQGILRISNIYLD